ncbi:MAG: glycoside hydrolase family 88 protein [Candidatus Hydrogenedentota bacterium]
MKLFPIAACVGLLAGLIALPPAAGAEDASETLQYHPATVTAPPQELPEGKRAPAGWGVQAIPREAGRALELHWNETEAEAVARDETARLRVTIGVDLRDTVRVDASIIGGDSLGELRIGYASTHQLFELVLSADEARAALEHGVALRQAEGGAQLFIMDGTAAEDAPPAPALQTPHLLTGQSADPAATLEKRLASLDTLQPFGWMEQCMIDGLADLGHDDAVRERLGLYVDPNGNLEYENPRSEPVSGRVYGIEGSGMFARIATHMLGNPALAVVRDFWEARRDEQGCVIDSNATSAEGCYTVAYPMAVLAAQGDAPELADEAVRQLLLRRDRLVHENALWLRHHAQDPPDRSFGNWARASAWYLLGWVRVMRELDDHEAFPKLEEELRRAADWVMARQRGDGLWAVYVDEPDLAADTAGAAGIAAALAIGHAEGWLDNGARESADRAYEALLNHLTPDGLLAGGSQSNKGGETLQRSEYRVILMPGTGLMAQLIAAREDNE